jgi:GT2 family glycosyltransferase
MATSISAPPAIFVAVIIVNYETPDLTIQASESVLKWFKNTHYRLVIVDNLSSDNSWDRLMSWKSSKGENISLVQSESNDGFSSGNNHGINAVDAEYYLLLNSDSIIESEDILNLFSHFSKDPSIGIIGPKLIDQSEHHHCSHFRFRTPRSELIDVAKTRLIDNFFKKYIVPLKNTSNASDTSTDWVSFACVLIRSEVFNQVGNLDDGFFMYFEDIDFCYRSNQAGWKIFYDDTVVMTHLRGGSSSLKKHQLQNMRLPKYYYESRSRYFYKTGGQLNLILANLAWSIGAMIALLRSLFGSKLHQLTARAWIDIWTNITNPLKAYTKPR